MSGIYPFDPSGLLTSNKLVNELHTVTAASGANLSFIVPLAAPFFRQGLVLRKVSGNVLLVEGVDYKLTHRFVEASHGSGKQIYGSIAFLDRNFTGQVKIEQYQTLGGEWTLNDNSIVATLTNSLYNIQTVTWSQITGMPVAFPPIVHDHEADDLTGMANIIAKLEDIRQSMVAGYGDMSPLFNALSAHISSPTAHVKANVGLGSVENFGIADSPEAVAGVVNNKYMTPLRVNERIQALNLRSAATKDIVLPGDAPAMPDANTVVFANGAFKTLSVAVNAPTQVENQLAFMNGAFIDIQVPGDAPTPFPADTLPLANGAFTQIHISNDAPVNPPAGTVWLLPIL